MRRDANKRLKADEGGFITCACGARARAVETECRVCGRHLRDVDFDLDLELIETKPKVPQKTREGAGAAIREEKPYECVYCGAILKPGDKICDACGGERI
jgi:predicted amidophosphoribosyltransferase